MWAVERGRERERETSSPSKCPEPYPPESRSMWTAGLFNFAVRVSSFEVDGELLCPVDLVTPMMKPSRFGNPCARLNWAYSISFVLADT